MFELSHTFFGSSVNRARKFGMGSSCFGCDHYISSIAGDFQGNGLADTTTGSGDEGSAASQFSGGKQRGEYKIHHLILRSDN